MSTETTSSSESVAFVWEPGTDQRIDPDWTPACGRCMVPIRERPVSYTGAPWGPGDLGWNPLTEQSMSHEVCEMLPPTLYVVAGVTGWKQDWVCLPCAERFVKEMEDAPASEGRANWFSTEKGYDEFEPEDDPA